MMEKSDREQLLRTIAEYAAANIGELNRLFARFSDADQIFPPRYSKTHDLKVIVGKDGVIIELIEDGSGSVRAAFPTGQSILRLAESELQGLFSFESESLDNVLTHTPTNRFADFSIQSGDKTRGISDIQLWTLEGARALTPHMGVQFAQEDVSHRLSLYMSGINLDQDANQTKQTLELALNEYEALLADDSLGEAAYQTFLQNNPIILSPGAKRVIPKQQIGVGKEYELDFLLEDVGGMYIAVEIEKPTTPIFTKNGDFRAEFTHSENQVLDFVRWTRDNKPTAKTAMEGLEEISGLLIVGRRGDFDSKQVMRFRHRDSQWKDVSILTFDDLLTRGRSLVEKLKTYR